MTDTLSSLQEACLACVTADPKLLDDPYIEEYNPDCFKDRYRIIWDAMISCHAKALKINQIIVQQEIADKGYENPRELEGIFLKTVDTSEWRSYFKALRNVKDRLEVFEIAETMQHHLQTGTDLIEVVTTGITALSGLDVDDSGLERIYTHKAPNLQSLNVAENDGVFGIPSLDVMMKKLGRGKVITVAGRPGQGKSILGAQCAAFQSLRGIPSAIVQKEMSVDELNGRLVSNILREQYTEIINEELWSRDLRNRIQDTLNKAYENLWVDDDSSDISPHRLCSQLKSLTISAGIEWIVIDYLGLLSTETDVNRRQVLSAYTRSLKKLATSLGVNIILVSQLNRSCEIFKRRPILADLAESGTVEQDSDVVIFLSPDGQWAQDGTFIPKKVKNNGRFHDSSIVEIAKFRNGEVGEAKMIKRFDIMRFEDAI